MYTPGNDGHSMMAKYGEGDVLPDPPELEDGCDFVLNCFNSLQRRRQSNMGGPQPITHQEIMAWRMNTNTQITAQEINMLTAADDAYLSAYHAFQERLRDEKKGSKNA